MCLPQGCISGSHFISLNILHASPGPSCLRGDLTLFTSWTICWEPGWHAQTFFAKQWACWNDSTITSVGRLAIVLSMLMDTAEGENWLQALTTRGLLVRVACFSSVSAGGKKKSYLQISFQVSLKFIGQTCWTPAADMGFLMWGRCETIFGNS